MSHGRNSRDVPVHEQRAEIDAMKNLNRIKFSDDHIHNGRQDYMCMCYRYSHTRMPLNAEALTVIRIEYMRQVSSRPGV
ncbi:uncharacterized protein PHALS_01204 [Plasmopara halstedii]|uniref:Uncharacterized protein n=1 Tax=Plasmopara halstedii TaxID=4781 RepID=A0A0P1AU25_PLAHL|nr:uncharacterized protein PHALS_01204 [Plasmopara halstedii]CEG44873.1 hypothetical protein PHALS_01204 [Plasmopara halstedii]|eukprot:XP_024581242.1 hypothetical protein PHALS_01204 [Plasmopara halstedii]